ncbi:zinc-binding dehydrogenase [Aquiflexum lacus]|uniref:zinc-binding dehydrogenase n=1 Tax=Aquiflexum lacus TaxID=2483805 RepID=UPI001895FB72|nr:zinc-binding dehydrogenase [Aquiflexum lacus]
MQGLMENGEFRPVLDWSYAIEKAAEAYRYVASGQKTGNVVLDIEGGRSCFIYCLKLGSP